MTEFQASEPRSWVRIWAVLVAGTLLGSSIVPVLTWKLSHSSGWAGAFEHGRETIWSIGIPTVIAQTVVLGVIVLILFVKKRKTA
ncbi:hypothetical protein SAMN05660282_02200 [Corynebacterium spheniscorum]|uniref:Uncharacterized protein n=1 Tax=Corynebacterium spheniscorum TaxID=185761 RepID=A0A1I2VB22_9CORY|nr:hypothetical protein SAMN05660282_02200 [Corynebacterium spheniscorum]